MSGMVEMVRNTPVPNGRDHFSCSINAWGFLQELGLTFGWRPQGTTYMAPAKLKAGVPARHNYQPGDALDYKRLDVEDAMAWARALETAKQSPQFASMVEGHWAQRQPEGDAPAQTLHTLIYEFIEYAHGGEFAFAAREQSPAHTR